MSSLNTSQVLQSTTGNTTDGYQTHPWNTTTAYSHPDSSTKHYTMITQTYFGDNTTVVGVTEGNFTSTGSTPAEDDQMDTDLLIGIGVGAGILVVLIVFAWSCCRHKRDEEHEIVSGQTEATYIAESHQMSVRKQSGQSPLSGQSKRQKEQASIKNKNCKPSNDRDQLYPAADGTLSNQPTDSCEPVYENLASIYKLPEYEPPVYQNADTQIYANQSSGILRYDGLSGSQGTDLGYTTGEFVEYCSTDDPECADVAEKYKVDFDDVESCKKFELYANINIPFTNWAPGINNADYIKHI